MVMEMGPKKLSIENIARNMIYLIHTAITIIDLSLV